MATWRITVKGDAAKLEQFKLKFYKQLYGGAGPELVFEVPGDHERHADEIVTAAKAEGFTAKKEQYVDPLDEAAPADFF